MNISDIIFVIISIFIVGLFVSIQHDNKKPKVKPEYESICIGGYKYELMVNEFNEPVWCEDNE